MRKIILFLCCSIVTFISVSQNTAIPDPNFEQALIDLGIDTNPVIDGIVPTSNINGIESLSVQNRNISDLTGIEAFVALSYLECNNNQLASLDISHNTDLTNLKCSSNELESLDVSNNIALTNLSCSSNELESLDVSNNIALTNLSCYYNQLISLDVSNNVALTNLNCEDNQLTSLDVSNNAALTN